jgi:hypothetical protein
LAVGCCSTARGVAVAFNGIVGTGVPVGATAGVGEQPITNAAMAVRAASRTAVMSPLDVELGKP